jgi:uncharacterized membrane protein
MNTFLDLAAPFALVVILTGVLFYWIPRLARPELYFAVTVPSGFRDSAEGRAILSQYRLKIVVASAAAVAILALGGLNGSLILLAAAVIIQQAGTLLAYFGARARVQPHAAEPTAVREALLCPRPAGLPGGWLAQAGPFMALAATALYLRLHWHDIPERFPIHWGLDGQPNGWAARTPGGVYGPLLIAAATCLMLACLAYGVLRASRPIQFGGAQGRAETVFRSTVADILVATEYLMAVVFAWTALLPIIHTGSGSVKVWALMGLSFLFVAVVTVLLARLGQGGTRAAHASPQEAQSGDKQPVGDRTQDRYWKGGLLYVNSEDPALFVEKRFGIGYTLNFGRPGSWFMLTALLLVPVVIALVVKWGGK